MKAKKHDRNKKQKNISLGSFYICNGCLKGLKKYKCTCKSNIKL